MAKKEPKSLNGRVVAITGGARGIGKATAAALVRQGAKVAIGDVDLQLAEATAAELGSGVTAYQLDVTKRPSMIAFLDAAEKDLGPLDVMINNAGIMPVTPFTDESDESAARQIDINIHGVIFGTKEAMLRMRPRRTGHIVNIASMAGKAGIPHLATYCATKHAVIGLSEAVRGELRGTGVEVTCIMPAVVNTELTSGVDETGGVKKIEPEDVADAIVDALQLPKFDVCVPKSAGRIDATVRLLPRSAREAIGRALKVDQIMVTADRARRAEYEARAARSEPAANVTPIAEPEAEREPERVA
jgi:NAD(P)-dependent dehydrogenase (short-subunit alcohol dehydrogenase family)